MKCNRCGEEKPPEDFYGRETTCKRCKKTLRNRQRGVKRAYITRKLGKQCVICREKGTTSHNIYGKKHPDLYNTPFDDVKKNCESGEFVKVCDSCHQEVHEVRERGIVDWDLEQHYVREFVKTNPPKERYPRLWRWHKFLDEKIIPKPEVGKQIELPINVESPPTFTGEEDNAILTNLRRFKERCLNWCPDEWSLEEKCKTCKQHYYCFPIENDLDADLEPDEESMNSDSWLD